MAPASRPSLVLRSTLVLLLGCQAGPGAGPDSHPDGAFQGLSARLDTTIGSLIYVSWTQPSAGTSWVEYRIADEDWRRTPARAFDPGAAEQIVLGAPFAEGVTFRVCNEGGASESATIETAPLPEGVPVPEPASGDPSRWDNAAEYVLVSVDEDAAERGSWWTLMLDRAGRVVWALASPTGTVSLYPRLSADGHAVLIDYNTFWTDFLGGLDSQVARTRIDGVVEATYLTPGLHHPYTQLPDDTIVWGALSVSEEDLQSVAPDGTTREIWSCGAWFDSMGFRDGCGSNSIYYDTETEHVWFSLYTVDTVVELDVPTGETIQWFGALPGAWAFQPPESQFWWQHGANLTEEGALLLSTHTSEAGAEATMVREYRLDAETRTLAQIWSWGDAAEDRVYSEDMGEAWRLRGGDTLHNYGTVPLLREITPTGEVVWRLEWSGAHTIGRSTPIEDLYALAPEVR